MQDPTLQTNAQRVAVRPNLLVRLGVRQPLASVGEHTEEVLSWLTTQ